MSALAEKLKNAGADTVGARVTTLCVEGLRVCHGNHVSAWAYVGANYGYALIADLAKDMKLPEIRPVRPERSNQPIQHRAFTPERTERRQKLREIVRSKYKNSGGVAWSDVGWHELPALARDGTEAKALLEAGPANVPNDGRTVGSVLGVKVTDQIVESVRAAVS